jgi:hypothetical protein
MTDVYLAERLCKGVDEYEWELVGIFSTLSELQKNFESLISLAKRFGLVPKLTDESFRFEPDEHANPNTVGYKLNLLIEKLNEDRSFLTNRKCVNCDTKPEGDTPISLDCVLCESNEQPDAENLKTELCSHINSLSDLGPEQYPGFDVSDLGIYCEILDFSYSIKKIKIDNLLNPYYTNFMTNC